MSDRSQVRITRAAFEKMWNDETVTTDQIAARFGLHRSSVSRIGERYGLPRRKTGAKREAIPAGLVDMWKAGVRTKDIARAIGRHYNYLARLASYAGLPKRRQGQHCISLSVYLEQRLAVSMAAAAKTEQARFRAENMVDAKPTHVSGAARGAM